VMVPSELIAESILLATGLLEVPTRTEVAAGPVLVEELRDQLLAVLERDDPARLRVTQARPSYAERLALPPDYEAITQALTSIDDAVAAEYVLLHQQAREALKARVPTAYITTSLGEVEVPPAADAQEQFLSEVDTIEIHDRLGKDAQAAALLPENVSLFAACYPQTYAWLCLEFETKRSELIAKKMIPPYWLDDVVRTLLRLPPEAPTPLPTPASEGAKGKPFNAVQLRTPAQAAAATPTK
jgi:hypothetical protein